MSGFDLNEVSSAFAISMGSIQLTVIYISLIFVRPATLETMDQMQSLVNERKKSKYEIMISTQGKAPNFYLFSSS